MKTCLVAVGFGHFFAQVQGFWKNFPQPKSPCIMCVQYIGGCSVHWGCSVHRGDIMSTSGGYHEYIRGYSVHQGDIMMNVGDTMSTSGGVQYIRGIP